MHSFCHFQSFFFVYPSLSLVFAGIQIMYGMNLMFGGDVARCHFNVFVVYNTNNAMAAVLVVGKPYTRTEFGRVPE